MKLLRNLFTKKKEHKVYVEGQPADLPKFKQIIEWEPERILVLRYGTGWPLIHSNEPLDTWTQFAPIGDKYQQALYQGYSVKQKKKYLEEANWAWR